MCGSHTSLGTEGNLHESQGTVKRLCVDQDVKTWALQAQMLPGPPLTASGGRWGGRLSSRAVGVAQELPSRTLTVVLGASNFVLNL